MLVHPIVPVLCNGGPVILGEELGYRKYDVEHHSQDDEGQEEDKGSPPAVSLPLLLPQVPQYHHAHQYPCHGATQMSHVSCLLDWGRDWTGGYENILHFIYLILHISFGVGGKSSLYILYTTY